MQDPDEEVLGTDGSGALAERFAAVRTGAGAALDHEIEKSGVIMQTFTAPRGKKITDDALRLCLHYGEQADGNLNVYGLILEADSEMTVVMDYTSEESAKGLAAVQTKILAEENAVLHLVQIQRLGDEVTFINDIGGECAESARIEVIRLILSGKNTYDGCRTALSGRKSSMRADIGYLVSGDGHLDMNYDAYHTAAKTECEINAAGVLRDHAFKLFRGTIDFQKGCPGAVGNEMEDVLLMDDTVINQTIPLILCAEEDVVGNHGATIGRLDENLLFYMESRGMDQNQIYEMMAKARIDAVIRRIPDEKTRLALTGEESEE